MSLRLTVAGARALMLAAQGLESRPEGPATKASVLDAIRRMEGLQIDTISVVARSPYFVLWSRLGEYEPAWLEELLAEGALFEYWSRAACFLPIEDYPLYRRRMLEYASKARAQSPYGRPLPQETIDRVLGLIREGGAVRSSEFVRTEGKSGGWWDWKPEKVVLEHLFNIGVLMIARRERFQRVYDLRERVLPEWDDATAAAPEEVGRAFVVKAIRALGVALPWWVGPYFPNGLRGRATARALRELLPALADEGAVVPVTVEGWEEPAYMHRDHVEMAAQAADGGLAAGRTTLLSPFDPITGDRRRALELFGFDYRIETYTPAAKRRFGYFSLPILHRGALVGRLDPKAHRRAGIFEVKAVHLEAGVAVTEELVSELAGAIRECATWHGTPEVVVGTSEPAELAGALRGSLGA